MPSYKHHYLPEFLQKQWRGTDEKLAVFQKGYNSRIVCKRRYPAETGYELGLYARRGEPKELAQALEDQFFSPVDSDASTALNMLVDATRTVEIGQRFRKAWCHFLTSLLIRMPEDLEFIRNDFGKLVEEYTSEPEPDSAFSVKTSAETLVNPQETQNLVNTAVSEFIESIVSGEAVVSAINDMSWAVLAFDSLAQGLFLSDRPVIRINGIKSKGGHLFVPVGPKHLFVATNGDDLMLEIFKIPANDIISYCNRRIVGCAKRFVYSYNESDLPFVKEHFGTIKEESITETSARRYKERSPT